MKCISFFWKNDMDAPSFYAGMRLKQLQRVADRLRKRARGLFFETRLSMLSSGNSKAIELQGDLRRAGPGMMNLGDLMNRSEGQLLDLAIRIIKLLEEQQNLKAK